MKIPPSETRSYSDIAVSLGKPTTFRAVAQANGANQLAIVVPCHRVINLNGDLGGYGRGLARKEWLLHLEKKGESDSALEARFKRFCRNGNHN